MSILRRIKEFLVSLFTDQEFIHEEAKELFFETPLGYNGEVPDEILDENLKLLDDLDI